VLRSWTKRAHIALHPAHVCVTTSNGGGRNAGLHTTKLDVGADEAGATWRAPLNALRGWLEASPASVRKVDLTLSDDFARYVLLPWSDAITSRDELASLTRLVFESSFGEGVAKWEMRSHIPEFGKAGLGCAIDDEFTSQLRQLLAEHRLEIVGLQPNFMRMFNCWSSQIGPDALVASLSGTRCVFGVIKDGEWHGIRSVHISVKQPLEQLVQREILVQGLRQDVPLYLHLVGGRASHDLQGLEHATVLDLAGASDKHHAALLFAGEGR
jgi:hypothetical protein